jgi:hypothetical protein
MLAENITAALTKNSDFSFEMSVLNKLVNMKFECEHSGTYVDPVKMRNREFDIRAIRFLNEKSKLHMAVECKNISATPLIVHRVPRRQNEAFHDVLVKDDSTTTFSNDDGPECTPTRILKLRSTPYHFNGEVGKAMDQAVQDGKGGIKLSDSEVFDKFSQALSSLAAMVDSIPPRNQSLGRHALLAILVVPDGALWTIDYSDKGVAKPEATTTDHVQYFVGKKYPFKSYPNQGEFILSHLDILTSTGLGKFLANYCTEFVDFAPLFPHETKTSN